MRWMLYHTQLKRISCFWVVGATQKYESKSFLFHWINTNIRRIWNSNEMGSLNCNQTKCLKKNKITIDIDLIDIPTDCFQQSNFNRAHFHILKSILNSFPHFGIVQISRAYNLVQKKNINTRQLVLQLRNAILYKQCKIDLEMQTECAFGVAVVVALFYGNLKLHFMLTILFYLIIYSNALPMQWIFFLIIRRR